MSDEDRSYGINIGNWKLVKTNKMKKSWVKKKKLHRDSYVRSGVVRILLFQDIMGGTQHHYIGKVVAQSQQPGGRGANGMTA